MGEHETRYLCSCVVCGLQHGVCCAICCVVDHHLSMEPPLSAGQLVDIAVISLDEVERCAACTIIRSCVSMVRWCRRQHAPVTLACYQEHHLCVNGYHPDLTLSWFSRAAPCSFMHQVTGACRAPLVDRALPSQLRSSSRIDSSSTSSRSTSTSHSLRRGVCVLPYSSIEYASDDVAVFFYHTSSTRLL